MFQLPLQLLAQDDGAAAAAAGGIALIVNLVVLAICIAMVVGMWKTFAKAGKPGWAAIIPIYNTIVMLEITGRPIWWVVLFLVPCVSIIVAVIVFLDLAKSFGASAGVGILCLFGIGFLILGFGNATYKGPAVTS